VRQRGFSPVIVVIILLFVISVGALLAVKVFKNGSIMPISPTPTPTSTPFGLNTDNWKLYTDPKAGFYFKYPDTYKAGMDGDFEMGKFMISTSDVANSDRILTYVGYDSADYLDVNDIREALLTEDLTKLLSHIKNDIEKKTITIKKFNEATFIKVDPYGYDGCFCRAIEYITITKDKKIIDIGVAQPRYNEEIGSENLTPNEKTFKEQYDFDPDEVMSTFHLSPSNTIIPVGETKEYTNNLYKYAIKISGGYEIKNLKSQNNYLSGDEKNLCIQQIGDTLCLISIDTYPNPDSLKLEEYIDRNFKSEVDGPVTSYTLNSYKGVIVKNHPGTDAYLSRESSIYHINAPTSVKDSKINLMLSTFRFTN
jgi:hypothetical protein